MIKINSEPDLDAAIILLERHEREVSHFHHVRTRLLPMWPHDMDRRIVSKVLTAAEGLLVVFSDGALLAFVRNGDGSLGACGDPDAVTKLFPLDRLEGEGVFDS